MQLLCVKFGENGGPLKKSFQGLHLSTGFFVFRNFTREMKFFNQGLQEKSAKLRVSPDFYLMI